MSIVSHSPLTGSCREMTAFFGITAAKDDDAAAVVEDEAVEGETASAADGSVSSAKGDESDTVAEVEANEVGAAAA